MAIIKDISFYRGEDVTLTVTMPEPITGWAITFTARAKATDTAALFTPKTVGSGIAIVNGAGGVFRVDIADSDTETLAAGLYVYDCKRTDAGFEGILVTGALNLLQDVTR